MTVINAMIFNNSQGAIIADEMGSSDIRKYMMFNKLQPFVFPETHVAAISSGAGNAEFTRKVMEETSWRLQESGVSSGDELVKEMGEIIQNMQKVYIDNIIKTTMDLSRADIMTGAFMDENGVVRHIEESIQKEASTILLGQHETTKSLKNTDFLTISYDPGGMKLNHNGVEVKTQPTKVYVPYASIGSGADTSDYILSSFFEKIPRESRGSIDPLEGLVALFQATDRAATRNHGVGGMYNIGLLSEDKITFPTEDSTKLASEIAQGFKKRYLTKEFTYSALQGLLYQNENPSTWEDAMWRNAGKKKNELSRLLRGYRV